MLHLSRNSQNRPVRSRECFKSSFEQVDRAIFVLVGDRKQLDRDCIVVCQSAKKVGLISDCGFISGKSGQIASSGSMWRNFTRFELG